MTFVKYGKESCEWDSNRSDCGLNAIKPLPSLLTNQLEAVRYVRMSTREEHSNSVIKVVSVGAVQSASQRAMEKKI